MVQTRKVRESGLDFGKSIRLKKFCLGRVIRIAKKVVKTHSCHPACKYSYHSNSLEMELKSKITKVTLEAGKLGILTRIGKPFF